MDTGYTGNPHVTQLLAEWREGNKAALELLTPVVYSELRQIAASEGMVELSAAGMEQVLNGRTTLEEVFYKLSG